MDTSATQPASSASSATSHAPLPLSTHQQTRQPRRAPNMGTRSPHEGYPATQVTGMPAASHSAPVIRIIGHAATTTAASPAFTSSSTTSVTTPTTAAAPIALPDATTTSTSASTSVTTTAIFQDFDLAQIALTTLLEATTSER